jgi:DNA repair protein RecO (recombination protein O)
VTQPLLTEGVLLRRTAYGESDLIVTLFTAAHGKLSAVARAARRSQRRFGAALQLFTLSRFELVRRPGGELWQLGHATLCESFTEFAFDMASLARASYATELVRELSAAEQAEPGLFAGLLEFYRALREVDAAAPAADSLVGGFELRVLAELGMAPVLDACSGCGEHRAAALARGAVLDPGRGGLVCRVCAADSRAAGVRLLSPEARAYLVALQQAGNLAQTAEIPLPAPEEVAAAREALMALVVMYAGHPLRSTSLLRELAGADQTRGE